MERRGSRVNKTLLLFSRNAEELKLFVFFNL